MNLFVSRDNFRSIGLALAGIGGLLLILGLGLVIATTVRRGVSRAVLEKMDAECVQRIKALEFGAALSRGEIVVEKKDISNGVLVLTEASLAVNSCPGWVLSRFCMGETCERPGLQFILQRPPAK